MKIPQAPPSVSDLFRTLGETPARWTEILRVVAEPTVSGRYIHWEKLRYRTPPAGLSHGEWWLGLKMKRGALQKALPLMDKASQPFGYCLIDSLQESLHYIDSLTHGNIRMPEQVTNQETRSSYIVRSLVEESITSSQIEGAATTREVAKEMIREGRPPRDRGERMIFNNYMTMQRIMEFRDQALTKEMLFEIHRMVTDQTLADPRAAGRFRRSEENIVVCDAYDEVVYRPPPAAELDSRFEAMCDFANGGGNTFIHPAIRSMILHFWVGYDHPFVDGNGRTARALFYWSMLRHNYWLFEFISISEVILKSHAAYGQAYLNSETDESDLTYFLEYHARVIRNAIKSLHEYIKHKSEEMASLQLRLRGMASLNYRQRELISHALRHPGFHYTYESHRKSHGIVHQTARMDLLGLKEKKLLRSFKRGRVWQFVPVPDLRERLDNQ